jgi:nucleoid-associated protein YgaU
MGKLEKVVVLSVLFVIAVILVVSLTMDNPIDKQNVSVLGQPAPAAPPAIDPALASRPPSVATPGATTETAPTTLLSTNVGTLPPANAPAAAPASPLAAQPAPTLPGASALPSGSLLRTTEGLQDSFVSDMKFYTWKAGDTYRGVAQTYYGDWEKLSILRRANEGRRTVQPGEKILVPVFDPDGASAASAVAVSPTPAKDASKKTGAKAGDLAASGKGRIHVVKEGESLWKIAKAELGNGALWEKIYAANKDVMKSPEALKTGMKLRIP